MTEDMIDPSLRMPGRGLDAAAPWTRPAKEAKAWFLERFVEYTARHRASQPDPAV